MRAVASWRSCLCLLLLCLSGAAHAEKYQIDGFRSARFGATQQEVENAIMTDFGMDPSVIEISVRPVEQTTSLTIYPQRLEPGVGSPSVEYVLGYSKKTLDKVRVAWRLDPPVEKRDIEHIRSASVVLSRFFEKQEWPGNSAVNGVNFFSETALSLFSVKDPDRRWLHLFLSGVSISASNESDTSGHIMMMSFPVQDDAGNQLTSSVGYDPDSEQGLELWLEYALHAENPDIYEVQAGEF